MARAHVLDRKTQALFALPADLGLWQAAAFMDQAMGETGVPEDLRARLRNSFFQTTDWMRNLGG